MPAVYSFLSIGNTTAGALVIWAGKSILLLGFALVIHALFRRVTASTRHTILFAALFALLISPLFSGALPGWQISLFDDFRTVSPSISPPSAETFEAGDARDQVPATEGILISTPSFNEMTRHLNLSLGFFMIWCGGTLFFLIRFIFSIVGLRHLRANAIAVTEVAWQDELQEIKSHNGLNKSILLLESPAINVPVTFGIVKPVIVLPPEFREWSNERMRIVLLHELSHIKRWDWLLQIFAQITGIIYWPNPLYWLTYHRMQSEREQACDDMVLASGIRSSDYASHLLEVAATLNLRRTDFGASIAMAKKSQLEGRLLSILDSGKKRSEVRFLHKTLVVTMFLMIGLFISSFAPFPQDTAPGVMDRIVAEVRRERGPEARVIVVLGGSIGRALPHDFTSKNDDSLRQAFQSDDWQVRAAAAYALGARFWSPPADLVTLALGDPRWQVRHFGAWAAENAADEALIEPLKVALDDRVWEVSHLAAIAIATLRPEIATEPLIRALEHPSWRTAHLAAYQLGQGGRPEAIGPLIKAVSSKHWMTRHVAAWALGEMQAITAVPALLVAINDKKWEVRKEAAKALGRIGDARAIALLQQGLQDKHEKVRAAATLALENF